jgi:hypothetical protein
MPRAFALMLAFGLLGAEACSSPSTNFHGVKLGMTPGDVRQRFLAPPGSWKATSGEEMILDYSPEAGTVPKVRFEFHSGMLVAIRATVAKQDPVASGSREITPGSVIVREPSGVEVALVWLSRDCPTHKDEAERLVRRSP